LTQQFDVSFEKPTDLTRRLVALVHSRLHRIRSVWLYNDGVPTVLRDVDYDIAHRVPFQEIQWYEPQRNDYRLEKSRAAAVEKDGAFEIQLAATTEFPRRPDNTSLNFEPMGGRRSACCSCGTPERTLFRRSPSRSSFCCACRRGPGVGRVALAPAPPLSDADVDAAINASSSRPGRPWRTSSSAIRARTCRGGHIEHALSQCGWSVFWDRDLLPGEGYRRAIERELKQARCVIVLWSRTSVESEMGDRRGRIRQAERRRLCPS
jgi:hypothetical protein